jgi:thiol-disulfide isomerase/thioredoxin
MGRKIIMIGAEWCLGCKNLKPTFTTHKRNPTTYLDVDGDKRNWILEKMVRSLPTFLRMDGDQVVDKLTTSSILELEQFLDKD